MRASTSSTACLAALALALLAPGPARAQDEAPALRELKRKLLVEGGFVAEQAAFDLFLVGVKGRGDAELGEEGSQDAFLREILEPGDASRREARLAVLRALRQCGRFRGEAAARLTLRALDDPLAVVATAAQATFATLDDDRGTVYRFLLQRMTVDLRGARPGTPRGKQLFSLIDLLERMPNPIEATGVLIALLEVPRQLRAVELRARESLQRLTAQPLEAAADWRRWFDEARGKSHAEWRLEVARRREERTRKHEAEAERYFARLLAALQKDGDLLLNELKDAISGPDAVTPVRRTAVRELGAMARAGGERGEKALNLLRGRLAQGQPTDLDETKALVVEALGETGNKAVLPDVLAYLNGRQQQQHDRMRMAAATAAGALQAAEAIDPLLAVLAEPGAPEDLLEVAIEALGRIAQNPDGKVSLALKRFADGQRQGSNGGAPISGSTSLLVVTVRALGALPYAPGGDAAQRVTTLLREVSAHEDVNVRNFAAVSLGTIPHEQAFPALVARLGAEAAPHVRRSIVEALGQQAIDRPDLAEAAIDLLVPLLDDPEEQIRRKVQQRLEEIATRPPTFRETFAGLWLLVQRILATKDATAAVRFLATLPAPEALTPAQQQQRPRYYDLLEVRARGLLATDAPAALHDFDLVITGLNLVAPATARARALHLGKARALVRLPAPRAGEALGLVAGCFPPQGAAIEDPDLWAAAVEVAERAHAADAKAVARVLGPAMAPHLSSAPPAAQARLTELVKAGT